MLRSCIVYRMNDVAKCLYVDVAGHTKFPRENLLFTDCLQINILKTYYRIKIEKDSVWKYSFFLHTHTYANKHSTQRTTRPDSARVCLACNIPFSLLRKKSRA